MVLFIVLLLFLVFLLLLPLIIGTVLLLRRHRRTGVVILGVYAALVGLFLVHAQLNRRSTSGHILRWLKGENGAHQQVNDLAEDAKKAVDPLELQHWAVNILQQTQQTNSTVEISRDNLPANIRNLGSFPIGWGFCDSDEVQDRTVWLVWGSGFGHWGIRVGSPTFKIAPAPNDNYYIEWKPGIYFWCETH